MEHSSATGKLPLRDFKKVRVWHRVHAEFIYGYRKKLLQGNEE